MIGFVLLLLAAPALVVCEPNMGLNWLSMLFGVGNQGSTSSWSERYCRLWGPQQECSCYAEREELDAFKRDVLRKWRSAEDQIRNKLLAVLDDDDRAKYRTALLTHAQDRRATAMLSDEAYAGYVKRMWSLRSDSPLTNEECQHFFGFEWEE